MGALSSSSLKRETNEYQNFNYFFLWEKENKLYSDVWVNYETSGQSYKHFTLVNYNSGVIIWGIFQSGMTLEL